MTRYLLRIVAVLLLLAAAAGCSSTIEEAETEPTPTAAVVAPTATPTPDPNAATLPSESDDAEANGADADGDEPDTEQTPQEPPPPPSDRIVIQTEDFRLLTIASDGTDLLPLSDPEETGIVNSQPTWSPDSNRIAWTRFDLANGSAQLMADRFDRSATVALDVESPPFYLNWDQASAQIGYLAPSAGGIDLGVATMAEDGEPKRLDRGEPFFFSWGSTGDEMLIHASGFRMDVINFDGTIRVIEEFPALFQAPYWVPGENRLIYADQVDGRNTLVSTGGEGAGRIPIVFYNGYLQFSVNADGTRIAVQSTDRGADSGVITASFAPTQNEIIPTEELLSNSLNVVSVFGGIPRTISFDPSLGFFWSPDGTALAFLLPGTTPGTIQWWFSTEELLGEPFPGPEFFPSDVFSQNYLPYFDQYEQSLSYWSPDGDRLVFAGTDPETGQAGIFTVEPRLGAQPEFLTDGVFAAWSPDQAGGGGGGASIL